MDAEYLRYVLAHLGNAPQRLTAQQRKAGYDGARQSLRDHYRQQGYSDADHAAAAARTLEAAIAQVEREFEFAAAPSHVPPPPPTHLDRSMQKAGNVYSLFKSGHAVVAFTLSLTSDFLKPILELTAPVMIGAGLGALALLGVARLSQTYRREIVSVAYFCGALSVCSAAWWGLQNVVPGANAKGVVAEVVPGLTAVQNAMLSSLGRIEQQTKRVGDLLEQSARQQESDRKQAEREMREYQEKQINDTKRKIQDFGYSLDAKGLAAAMAANDSVVFEYKSLGISLTADAAAAQIKTLNDKNKVNSFLDNLASLSRDDPAVRRIYAAFGTERDRLVKAFRQSRARDVICNPPAQAPVIAPETFKTVCALSGMEFAAKFDEYFREHWFRVSGSSEEMPQAHLYLQQAPAELPVVKLNGPIDFPKLQACKYYQGNLSFWVYEQRSGISDAGSILPTRSLTSDSYEFYFFDDEARPALAKQCNRYNVKRADQQCRAEVIFITGCDGVARGLVKVLGNASDGLTAAAAIPPPPPSNAPRPSPNATPLNDPVSYEELQKAMIPRSVQHGTNNAILYMSEGGIRYFDGRVDNTGTYTLERDGRMCWKLDTGAVGCFQYYRKANAIYVRRNDPASSAEIGIVKLAPGGAPIRTQSDAGPPQPGAAAAPSARAPVQTAAASAPQAAARPGGALSAADVRKQLVGWDVEHDGKTSFAFAANGTFDAVDGRTASNGTYRIENDGRVCWQNSRGVSGCFRYYRAAGGLRVKREDAQSTGEIGAVVVAPLARAR